MRKWTIPFLSAFFLRLIIELIYWIRMTMKMKQRHKNKERTKIILNDVVVNLMTSSSSSSLVLCFLSHACFASGNGVQRSLEEGSKFELVLILFVFLFPVKRTHQSHKIKRIIKKMFFFPLFFSCFIFLCDDCLQFVQWYNSRHCYCHCA